MAKVITKRTHQKLDFFVSQQTEAIDQTPSINTTEQRKKTIKKGADGLIERLDKKIIISEDNRELLND